MTKQELLESINKKKQEVIDLVEKDQLESAAAAKEELKVLQAKFELVEDLDGGEGQQEIQNRDKRGQVKVAGAGNAAAQFAEAARAGFRVTDSMSSGMREGSDPDGGYVVPEDIQTTINQFKQAEASLEDLITVETTTTNKGSRTYEKKSQVIGFEDIEEGGVLSEMDTPEFTRIPYEILERGGWLPLTNDLLNDTDQNITNIITRWIARKSNATSNNKILGLIRQKALAEIEGMDEIKEAIIVTLGSAYRAGARILTNDDGLLWLATLKDTTGRDLLCPDPKDVMQLILSVGPLRIPITSAPNEVITSDITEKGKRKIPFVCGDFKEAFKKYDRQKTTLLSSNTAAAGSVNAFTQNLTLVRAIERNDFRTIDSDAFVNLSMVVDDAKVAGK